MPTELETDKSIYAESSQAADAKTTDTSTAETVEQVKRVTAQVVDNLGELPKYFGEFFSEYKRPLLALGLIFGAFISVKLTLAILAAIND
ncbi:MAG: hypothetical protein AAFV46_00855, partial [Cyanobacteria bacterium J06635_11]